MTHVAETGLRPDYHWGCGHKGMKYNEYNMWKSLSQSHTLSSDDFQHGTGIAICHFLPQAFPTVSY